jgi:dynein heavy chain
METQRLAPSTSPTKEAMIAKVPVGVVNFEPNYAVSTAPHSPTRCTTIKDTSHITAPTSFVQVGTGFSVGGGHAISKIDLALREDGDIEPKVFVPYERMANLPPRKVEVERKKRLYESAIVGELLKQRMGSFQKTLMYKKIRDDSSGAARMIIDSLSLHFFDDESYEIHSPQEWIRLGKRQDGSVLIPVTALYTVRGLSSFWCDGHVVGYNAATQMYAVKFQRNKKAEMVDLKRLDICFKAEDPTNFADRYMKAQLSRLQAQNLLRKNLYVDCMPVEELH